MYAPIHQHFFNVRLDVTVDGPRNSVYEVQHGRRPAGAGEPARRTPSTPRPPCSARESEAQRLIDPLAGRFWKIVNPAVRNRLGTPVGYKLVPGENVLPFAAPEASGDPARRAS